MKNCFYILFVLIILYSCQEKVNEKTKKNVLKEVVLNNLGDTLVTGKYIDLNFTETYLDSTIEIKNSPLGNFSKIQDPTIVGEINQTFICKFNSDSIQKYSKQHKKQNREFKLQNYTGDVIETNQGKTIQFSLNLARLPIESKVARFTRKDKDLFNFSHLSANEGLNNNYRDLTVTNSNKIVFASDNKGFQILDQKSLKTYNSKNGFDESSIYKVIELQNGSLAFGTWGKGLIVFDGVNFKSLNPDNGLSSDLVTSLMEDSKGNLWIGTWEGGVAKLKNNKLTHYALESGLGSLSVTSIFEDSKGRIWFGTFGGGVSFYENGTFNMISQNSPLKERGIMAFTEDKNANLYIGTYGNGLFKIQNNVLHKINIPDPNWDSFISSLHFDGSENLWVGTARNGVYKIEKDKVVSNFNNLNGFSINNIISIKEDKQKTIWFAAFGDGVYTYNESSFQTIQNYHENINLIISSICKIKKRTFIGSINSQGLYFTENKQIYKYDNLTLKTQTVNLQEDNNSLLISTNGSGFYKLAKSMLTQFLFKEGGGNNSIKSVFVDKEQNYWVASDTGLKVIDFKNKKVKIFTENGGLATIWVKKIQNDHLNNKWLISHGAGISKMTGNKIIHFTKNEGLSDNNVNSFYIDDKDRVFVGTNAGINLIVNDKVLTCEEFEIFNDLSINSIKTDKNNGLWLSTSIGLFYITMKIEANGNISSFKNHFFDAENGLKSTDYFENSLFIDKNNKLWLGSGVDLFYKDLSKLKLSNTLKKPEITKLEINSVQYHFNDSLKLQNPDIDFNALDFENNIPIDLSLPFKRNHLSFYFISNDNVNPEKIKYSYKLEGLDENWSAPDKENKAEYKNLPYGSFKFLVKSIGQNNKWSETKSYAFEIRKPFWATWWFRITSGLLILFLIFRFIKFRTKKLIETQIQLENTVADRTKELKEEKRIVEEKNKEITDSITYAKRIQSAILPPMALIKSYFPESFLLYKPKDIVAGDFYWFEEIENRIYFAAADCTGHGVPGALVSVVCHNALNRSIKEYNLTDPAEILNKTREIVIQEFEKSHQDVKDGMDISLCVMEKNSLDLKWAGAHNPLWILRNGEILEWKADKQPIGKFEYAIPFTPHKVELKQEDEIYLFTDGYQDQFGGEKGKKFKTSQMRSLFSSLNSLNMDEKQEEINIALEN